MNKRKNAGKTGVFFFYSVILLSSLFPLELLQSCLRIGVGIHVEDLTESLFDFLSYRFRFKDFESRSLRDHGIDERVVRHEFILESRETPVVENFFLASVERVFDQSFAFGRARADYDGLDRLFRFDIYGEEIREVVSRGEFFREFEASSGDSQVEHLLEIESPESERLQVSSEHIPGVAEITYAIRFYGVADVRGEFVVAAFESDNAVKLHGVDNREESEALFGSFVEEHPVFDVVGFSP